MDFNEKYIILFLREAQNVFDDFRRTEQKIVNISLLFYIEDLGHRKLISMGRYQFFLQIIL